MNVKELLFTYSEWLDSEGLIIGDDERSELGEHDYQGRPQGDNRTHEQLVQYFLLDHEMLSEGEQSFLESEHGLDPNAGGRSQRALDLLEEIAKDRLCSSEGRVRAAEALLAWSKS